MKIRRFLTGLTLAALYGAAAPSLLARECIGVVPAGGGRSFWGEVEQGALRAGEKLGIDIYFRGPADENTPQTQVSIINIIEEKHCIALVLAPNVAERSADVARLKARGIPTVYIDRDYGGAEVVAVLATDNYRAGQLAGEKMADLLGSHGHVALFRMKQGVQSTDERERGFLAAARARGLEVSLEVWLGSAIGEARQNAVKALNKRPTHLEGIFTPNESTTLATLSSLRQLDLAGKIKLIGFDVSELLLDAIHDKDLHGIVVQRPQEMGYEGVLTAYRAAKGTLPAKHHLDTGVFFVSPDNLDSAQIRQALAPFLGDPPEPPR